MTVSKIKAIIMRIVFVHVLAFFLFTRYFVGMSHRTSGLESQARVQQETSVVQTDRVHTMSRGAFEAHINPEAASSVAGTAPLQFDLKGIAEVLVSEGGGSSVTIHVKLEDDHEQGLIDISYVAGGTQGHSTSSVLKATTFMQDKQGGAMHATWRRDESHQYVSQKGSFTITDVIDSHIRGRISFDMISANASDAARLHLAGAFEAVRVG